MSKGSNATTTEASSSVRPTGEAARAYSDLMARALGVSQKPYDPYTGESVAPLNTTQQNAITGISGYSNAFAPYAGMAGENIQGAAEGIDANDIAQYYDPWQQSVVDATMADFDTLNKRANTITTGNAAAQNALGGNRVGVAQALTQEGQTRAQAPVLAGLRSTGFQNAAQAAQAAKNRQLQAGVAELQGGAQGYQQALQAGTLAQQTTQAQDTQARADFFQKQGYDFATAQWLASIILPTGAQMGSNTTGNNATQGPQPNQWLQAAGVGLSAAAMFSDRRLKENIEPIGKLLDGQTIYRFNFKGDDAPQIGLLADEVEQKHPEAVGQHAGFGTIDLEGATDEAAKLARHANGGRISGFADGGVPAYDVTGGIGWVPSVKLQGHPLQASPFPQHAKMEQQKDQMPGIGKSLGTIGKSFLDSGAMQGTNFLDTDSPDSGLGVYTGPAWQPGFAGSPDLGGSSGVGASMDTWFADGGVVPTSTGFGGGFASGGAPDFPWVFENDHAPFETAAGRTRRSVVNPRNPGVATIVPEAFGFAPVVGWEVGKNLYKRARDVKGYELGGSPTLNRDEVIDLTDLPPLKDIPPSTAADRAADANALRMSARDPGADPMLARNLEVVGDEPITGPRQDEGIVPTAMRAFKNIASGQGKPKSAMNFADDAPDDAPTDISSSNRTIARMAGVSGGERQTVPPGVAAPTSTMGGFNPLNLSDEARQGLISMGLGMMANRRGGKGSFLAGVGEAGEQGMTTYASARERTLAQQAQARKEAFEREKFERPYNEPTAAQRLQFSREALSPLTGTFTADGHPVGYDKRRPGVAIDMLTGKPLTPEQIAGVQKGKWKPYRDYVTPEGDPVLVNDEGRMKNAISGQVLEPGAKVVSAKDVQLGAQSLASRAYQLALGDIKSAYAGLSTGLSGNREKSRVYDQAVKSLMDAGLSEKEVAEYLSEQQQHFAARGIGMNAESRTAATREANLKIILKATDAAIPAALEASEALARSGLVPLNRIIEKGRVIASDPLQVRFGMANLQLAEHWARAMNPTGVMRESDRDMALHFLDTALSKKAYSAAVDQLKKQIEREKAAVESVQSLYGPNAKGKIGKGDEGLTTESARKEVATVAPPANTAPPVANTPPVANKLSPQDQQAMDWANANPTDPRAAAIKKKLGVP